MSDKIGTHAFTKGPCIGVHKETGEKRTFRTRTACKKAGYQYVETLGNVTGPARDEPESYIAEASAQAA